MQLAECPELPVLERLLLGKLPADEHDVLGEHLLHCDECAARADQISSDDPLTSALRSRLSLASDEPILAQAIERARELRRQLETVETEETVAVTPGEDTARRAGAKRAHSMSDEPIDFLHPAEQPDEIGRLGGYRVLAVMGVGGMGVVFQAEDRDLKRQVALKAMKPVMAASRTAKERFLREAQAAAALDHDDIVHIYQVGEDRGIPFIAMQYLRGESLQMRLDRAGRMAPRELVRIARQVADGLGAAHTGGLIHRDIKPDNIWLEESSDRAKILDFGLARAPAKEDSSLTQAGMVVGTPKYMAPEQARGEALDHRCDLFSLGSVMYHLASGQPPFTGENVMATLMAVSHGDCRPISELCPQLHPELSSLITALMSPRREDRPQSADEVSSLLSDIDGKLVEQELANRSAQRPTTAKKRVSRRAGLFFGAVVALALALILWVAAVLVKFETRGGTILVEIDGKGKPVSVDVTNDRTLSIKDPSDGKKIDITVDRRRQQLRLDKEGFRMVVKKFSLQSPDGRQISVRFVPNEAKDNTPTVAPPTEVAAGSYEWPAGAPPPAIAPFSAEEAAEHQQAWAKYLDMPVEQEVIVGKDAEEKDVKLTLVLIPPGEFTMGADKQEQARFLKEANNTGNWVAARRAPSEGPQHRVRITQPFYLGKFEVTQAQWLAVVGHNPSKFNDDPSRPVDGISWNAIQPFLAKLNEEHADKALKFALPTEAQWEYACRAGTTTVWHSGDTVESLKQCGWYGATAGGQSQPVGRLDPNGFGLYDMHGNMWEWCADWHAWDYYISTPENDPQGPSNGTSRVHRGGAWDGNWVYSRSAHRGHGPPGANGGSRLGFRLAARIVTEETPDDQPSAQADIPLPVGSYWLGRRTYRRGAYQGATVHYELHIGQREGNTFQGHVFDNGKGRNYAVAEGEIIGDVVKWTEKARGNTLTMEAKLAGDELTVAFTGLYSNGARNVGDGKLTRVRSQDE